MDRIIKKENDFNKWVKAFCDKKLSFEVIKNGNYYSLQPPEQAKYKNKIIFYNKENKSESIKGKHLISVMKKAVMNYDGVIPDNLTEPNTLKFNKDCILETEFYKQIDLNSAYWTAAYRLGYLTKLQWINGMDEDYKSGCVSSIGCLKRTFVKDIYKDGLLFKSNVKIEVNDIFVNARLHIINYVNDIMLKCADLAGSNQWLLISTDAITLHYTANKKSITDYLMSIGFQYKFETIELTNITNTHYEYHNRNKGQVGKQRIN